MNRLLGAIALSVVLAVLGWYGALLVAGPLVEFPTAVVCDRRAPNTEVSSTDPYGYFEVRQVGPCEFYFHKSRVD